MARTPPAGRMKSARICGSRADAGWATNEMMREAELGLARQAEVSYRRMVQGQQARGQAKKVGASATLERASI